MPNTIVSPSLIRAALPFTWMAALAGLIGFGLRRADPVRRDSHALTPPDSRGSASAVSKAESASAATPPPAQDDPRARLGQAIFFDERLSRPAGTSCASCHDPRHGYAGNHGATIGVAAGSRPGHFARRNTPSVLYLRFVRRFQLEWDDEKEYPEASGGFFWDGRESSLSRLVRQPLLNPDEMNNPSEQAIAEKLRSSAYADALRLEFDGVFDTTENTLEALGLCLEAFLTSRKMSPFSSKFDDFVRGRAALTALEGEGLALFENPAKGACSGCHRIDPHSALPEASLLSDFGYDTVAVPRNRELPKNRAPAEFDLGLCEHKDPLRHTEDPWFCGAFRTPSLRNVALRERFMHNGAFDSLRRVVEFYATRNTNPARWYPSHPFDDLPERYHGYVNRSTPPYDQAADEPPRLSDHEIDAIVSFLGTLTDRDIPGE